MHLALGQGIFHSPFTLVPTDYMVIRTPASFPSVQSKATRGTSTRSGFIGSAPQPQVPTPPTVWMVPGTSFSASSPVSTAFASGTAEGRHREAPIQPPELFTAGRSSRSQSAATPLTNMQTPSSLESRSVTSPASQIYSGPVLTPIPGLFTPIGIVQAGGKK